MASAYSTKLSIEVFWSAHQSWLAAQTRGFLPLHNVIFWIVEQGEATLEMNGKSYSIREGEAVLQPANQERYITARTDFRWLSVGFRAYWFGGQDIFHSFDTPYIWKPEATNRAFLAGCLSEIVVAMPIPSISSQLRVEGAMRSILGHCFENCPIPQSTSEFPMWLENALQILRDEPNIELNDLAARIGYSPSQFRAQFKRWMGINPSDYMRDSRMKRARQLLLESDWTIGRIADELGFAAPTHFVRAFKAETGTTPAKFRQNSGF